MFFVFCCFRFWIFFVAINSPPLWSHLTSGVMSSIQVLVFWPVMFLDFSLYSCGKKLPSLWPYLYNPGDGYLNKFETTQKIILNIYQCKNWTPRCDPQEWWWTNLNLHKFELFWPNGFSEEIKKKTYKIFNNSELLLSLRIRFHSLKQTEYLRSITWCFRPSLVEIGKKMKMWIV